MASTGLNKWIVSGNLGADVQVKTVDLRSGEKAQVASASLYVRGVRDRKESFIVSLTIWERSAAWRKLPYLKKGSLVICTGSVEPRPYLSSVDNRPRAGLSMSVLDINLDIVKDGDEPEDIQDFSSEIEGEDSSHADSPDLVEVGG
ncbi:MAG: single-stranded DNA-binding protein [Synechococcales bacterium]|nr:single-stranded DNA-binding protein [Synechococcales bacterium]